MPKPGRAVELEMVGDLPVPPFEWYRMANLLVFLIGLVLMTILFGFGAGLVGRVRAQTVNGALRVSYDSFSRLDHPTQLKIHLPGLASATGQASMWVDHSFIEQYQVEDISPAPLQVQFAGEWTLYTFDTATPGQALEINFALRPIKSGLQRGRVGWGQEPGLHISQFVIP
jgi:hypothetical protein